MFASKATAFLVGFISGPSTRRKPRTLLASIRFAGTNTLAYSAAASMVKRKSLITLEYSVNVINPFSQLTYELTAAGFVGAKFFHTSLMFVIEVVSLPREALLKGKALYS
jgi:hypothetical protein